MLAKGQDESPTRGVGFISPAERSALADMARSFADSEGLIVDGGCFLGASTLALASGLADEPTCPRPGRIVSVDHFQIRDVYIQRMLASVGVDLPFGASYLPIFLSNIAKVRDLVDLRVGDLREVGAVDGDVDLAFIDICKTPALNAYVVLTWLSRMTPGSLIVQQDFHSPITPWIAASLGLASGYLSLTAPKIGETAVFRVEEALPRHVLSAMATISPYSHEALAAIGSLTEHFPPAERHTLALTECMILCGLDKIGAARERLNDVLATPHPKEDAKWNHWVSRVRGVIDDHAQRRGGADRANAANVA